MSSETIQAIATLDEDQVTPIVIDFGKQSRKSIRQVRKGKSGKLMDKIQQALTHLRDEGGIAPSAQPVIVFVRQRRRSRGLPGLFR